VTAELPGEKDIKVSVDDNQLVISGEKKAESARDEFKDNRCQDRRSTQQGLVPDLIAARPQRAAFGRLSV